MKNSIRTPLSKMKNLLIFGFIGLLVLPTLVQLGGWQFTERVLKRKLHPFPTELNMKWPQQVKLWHYDHVGFKNSLIVGHNRLKYNVLKTTPNPSKVLMGEEPWLFSHFHDNIFDKYNGKYTFKKKQLERVVKKLEDTQAYLAEHGIDFYFAIAPAKYRCAKDYLPDYFADKELYSHFDQFKEYISSESTTLQWVDLKSDFPKGYDAADLFRKQDIHWNGIGGYWGAVSLLSKIKENHPEVVLPTMATYYKDTVMILGSTLRMLNLPDKEELVSLKLRKPPFFKATADHWEVPAAYKLNPDFYERRYENAVTDNQLKVFIFHDSFMGAMTIPVNESIHSVIYHNMDFKMDWWDLDFILGEKPDIFLLELSEGFFPYLLSPQFSVPASSIQ